MRLLLFILALPLVFESGCFGNKHRLQGENGLKVKFDIKSIQKSLGDCSAANSACAQIDLTFPEVSEGVSELADAINDSIYMQLIQNLVFESYKGVPNEKNLLLLADTFLYEWQRAAKAGESGSNEGWEVNVTGEVGLHTPKVAVVSLGTYSYAGGAHPNSFTAIFNFDLKTGRTLKWEDFITDMDSLKALAEKKFKNARELPLDADLATEGYFWEEQFSLPNNFELQEEGIYFWYNPYEAASYAEGPTDFLISYEELGKLVRREVIF